MCGASDQQTQISQAQQDMYNTLSQNYATAFGQQQQLLSSLTSAFQPIVQAGPGQQGYSAGEMQAMNTQASENIAAQYANAARATAQTLAGRGGDTFLPSSITANITANTANQAALARATALNQNTQASYEAGRQNWQSAANVLQNVAQLQNPNAYASSATSGGTAAANTAAQIAAANNSIWNSAIGAVGALGGAALGNVGSLGSLWGKGAQQVLANPNPLITGYQSTINAPAPTLAPSNMWTGGVPNLAYNFPNVSAAIPGI